MAQRRMISKSLGYSRKFHAVNAKCGKPGDFAQALFPLIVVHADDFGRLDGDAFTIKHMVFPVSQHSEADFETALQGMHEVGLICLYEVGGDRYVQEVSFDREQPGLDKRTSSTYPEPPEIPGKSGNFPELPEASGKVMEIPSRTEQTQSRTEPEQKGTEDTQNGTAADAAVSRTPEVLVEIYKARNEKLPQVLEFNPSRREKCKRRLARDPGKFIDQFTRAVIKAQETPFLRGENERGWKADFDWFIANDQNVIKVLEGRYDSGGRADPRKAGGTVFDRIRRERQEGKDGSDRVA